MGVYRAIASTLGMGAEEAGRIAKIVELSDSQRMLYHGIKVSADAARAREEGIKPLTPECGPCSFWASGIGLFEPMEDSPLFCWSGNYESGKPNQQLNLAVMPYGELSRRRIKADPYNGGGNVLVYKTVPPEAFVMLSVDYPSDGGREARQAAERMLLAAIAEQLDKLRQSDFPVSSNRI